MDMRSFRRSLAADQRAELSERISFHLLKDRVFSDARTLHVFWPMIERGEVDIRPLILQAHERDVEVWLPVVDGQSLLHRPFKGKTRMAPGEFGQLEPLDEPTRVNLQPDLVIAPGLAVDASGNRLGYGGGYYDQFLARLRNAPLPPTILMVLFDGQLVESVPHAAHDIPVDAFATESGLTWCNTQRQSV